MVMWAEVAICGWLFPAPFPAPPFPPGHPASISIANTHAHSAHTAELIFLIIVKSPLPFYLVGVQKLVADKTWRIITQNNVLSIQKISKMYK
jgi:hypothetical protein